jgi:thiamine-monophosphate kinase
MDEFRLIDAIVLELGDRAAGEWIKVGPGDDCAVVAMQPDHDAVASIDTLIEGVHFPADQSGRLIGYRALMVAVSDLAAMAASPRYALVGLSIPAERADWAIGLAAGMRCAAQRCGVYVCGGNIARGPVTITVSVHGEVPEGQALLRSRARVGDGIFVSGPLGGAHACVRLGRCESHVFENASNFEELDALQQAYYLPTARVDLVDEVRGVAHAGIDVSDGFLQDLDHVLVASGVGAEVVSSSIPVHPGATLEDALAGGDDYQLLCTGHALPSFVKVGEVVATPGIRLDGREVEPRGFKHFDA